MSEQVRLAHLAVALAVAMTCSGCVSRPARQADIYKGVHSNWTGEPNRTLIEAAINPIRFERLRVPSDERLLFRTRDLFEGFNIRAESCEHRDDRVLGCEFVYLDSIHSDAVYVLRRMPKHEMGNRGVREMHEAGTDCEIAIPGVNECRYSVHHDAHNGSSETLVGYVCARYLARVDSSAYQYAFLPPHAPKPGYVWVSIKLDRLGFDLSGTVRSVSEFCEMIDTLDAASVIFHES